jgi:hypothetical protein
MPQLTYTLDPAIALPGQIFDSNTAHVDSGAVQAAAGLTSGRFCKLGSQSNPTAGPAQLSFDAISSNADAVFGCLVRKVMAEPSTPDFPQFAEAGAMRRGRIAVNTSGAVARNAALYVVASGANAGQLTTTSTSNIALKNVEVLVPSAADQGIAIIDINFPGES